MTKLLYAADTSAFRPGHLWVAGLASALLTAILCLWIRGHHVEAKSSRAGDAAPLFAPVFLVLA